MDLDELREGMTELSQDAWENAQNNTQANIELEKWEAAMSKWRSMTGEEAYEEMYQQGKQNQIPLAF